MSSVNHFAQRIGINPVTESDLMWIAEEGFDAIQQTEWRWCDDASKEEGGYYFNFRTAESEWDHPIEAQQCTILGEQRYQKKQALLVSMPKPGDSFRGPDGTISTVLKEDDDPAYEPTPEEINEYAAFLGLDPTTHPHLLWIAKEGLKAHLPEEWCPCKTSNGEVYYYNFLTQASQWEHPMDEWYKGVLAEYLRRDEVKSKNAPAEQEDVAPLSTVLDVAVQVLVRKEVSEVIAEMRSAEMVSQAVTNTLNQLATSEEPQSEDPHHEGDEAAEEVVADVTSSTAHPPQHSSSPPPRDLEVVTIAEPISQSATFDESRRVEDEAVVVGGVAVDAGKSSSDEVVQVAATSTNSPTRRWVWGVVSVVVLAAAAGVSWYVFQQQKNNTHVISATSSASASASQPSPSTSAVETTAPAKKPKQSKKSSQKE